jgi:hypothetical protein
MPIPRSIANPKRHRLTILRQALNRCVPRPVTLAGQPSPPAPTPKPMPMTPLPLTDDQLATIQRAAAPIAAPDRVAFLAAVAQALQGREIGDGVVARVCAEQQRKWFTPPAEEGYGARFKSALVEKKVAR